MSNMYTKSGRTFSKYLNTGDDDAKAKQVTMEILKQKGHHPTLFSQKEPEYDRPDILYTSHGQFIFVETEIKYGWQYIREGIHFAGRKGKFLETTQQFYLFQFDPTCRWLVIVPHTLLALAESVKGYRGFGRVPSSPDFVMPDHGCYRLKKYTNRHSAEDEPEDFYNIDFYHRLVRYRKVNKDFSLTEIKK